MKFPTPEASCQRTLVETIAEVADLPVKGALVD